MVFPAHLNDMNANEQPRQPAGAPRASGGQWKGLTQREAGIDLTGEPATEETDQSQESELRQGLSLARQRAIGAGANVPATFSDDPLTGLQTIDPGEWWDDHAAVAEWRDGWAGKGAAFPKMPVDWTPTRTGGSADTGLRRTHRRTYEGNGFRLRMPSAASVRSFADVNRGAFDVPVEATNAEGQTITAWVRAVRHRGGGWSISGLGFGGSTDAQVSEAVASVLEARRPTLALRQAGDLLEKHRLRLEANGQRLQEVRSGWISGVGYDDIDRIMIMRTKPRTTKAGQPRPGVTYGNHVSRDVFEQLVASEQPGAIFNRLVRGTPGQIVATCVRCRRSYPAARQHDCPAALAQPGRAGVVDDPNLGRRSALRGIRRRRRVRNVGQESPGDTGSQPTS